jgi:hypothetical protein
MSARKTKRFTLEMTPRCAHAIWFLLGSARDVTEDDQLRKWVSGLVRQLEAQGVGDVVRKRKEQEQR